MKLHPQNYFWNISNHILFIVCTVALIFVPQFAISGQTWRCNGGVFTDRPQDYNSCINIQTNKSYNSNVANDNAVDQRSAELELPSNYQNPLTATGAEMAHFSKQVACIMKLAALKVIQNREKRNMSTEKEMQDFYIKSNLCNKREEEFEALFAKLDRDTQKKAACKILENLERSIINQKNPEIRQLNMKESIRYKRNCLWE